MCRKSYHQIKQGVRNPSTTRSDMISEHPQKSEISGNSETEGFRVIKNPTDKMKNFQNTLSPLRRWFLMFFRLGYLKHPQNFKKISTNISAFFIFFMLILLAIPITKSALCGDAQCDKGYDTVGFILNLSEEYLEDNLKSNQSSVYILDETHFFIKVLNINNMRTSIQINTTKKNLSVGENFLFNSLRLEIKNISTIENEEITCPQDCFEGMFVELGKTFNLGTSFCKDAYKFVDINEDNNTIIIKKGEEIFNLSYDTTVSNQFGNPLIFQTKIHETGIQFHMRYNQNTTLLYLEDANQTCSIIGKCVSNKDCEDGDECTIDECQLVECAHTIIAYCKSGDGCCPIRCNYTADNDCKMPDICTKNLECDDNNKCTVDLCVREPNYCINLPINNCTSGDGCCPVNCDYKIDSDCPKIIVCKDGVCEENETKENCCLDCGCDTGYECQENKCVKILELEDKQDIERKSTEGEEDLESKVKKIGTDKIIFFSEKKSGLIKIAALSLITSILIFSGFIIYKNKAKRKKEEYYRKLLQQRYFQQRPMYQQPMQRYQQQYPQQRQQSMQRYQQQRQQQPPQSYQYPTQPQSQTGQQFRR